MTKVTKFQATLQRDNNQIKRDRAVRVSNAGERAVREYIFKMEGERDQIEEVLAAGTDLSTSNKVTTINAIDAFDARGWAERMVENRLKLRVLNERLQEANSFFEEWFVPDIEIEDEEADGDA